MKPVSLSPKATKWPVRCLFPDNDSVAKKQLPIGLSFFPYGC